MENSGRYGNLFSRVESDFDKRYGDLLITPKNGKSSVVKWGFSDIRVKIQSFRGYEPISVFGKLINEVKTAISEFEQNKENQGELDKIKDEIPRFLRRGLKDAEFVIGRHRGKPCAFICSNKSEAKDIICHNPQDGLQLSDYEDFAEDVDSAWKDIKNYNFLSDSNILIFTT